MRPAASRDDIRGSALTSTLDVGRSMFSVRSERVGREPTGGVDPRRLGPHTPAFCWKKEAMPPKL